MESLRTQFVRKSILVTIIVGTVVMLTALAAFLCLPTIRADRFARLVLSGNQQAAEEMLPESFDDSNLNYRQVLSSATTATVVPISFSQVIRGERAVIVGKGWGGGDAEFVITTRSISPGRNWFAVF